MAVLEKILKWFLPGRGDSVVETCDWEMVGSSFDHTLVTKNFGQSTSVIHPAFLLHIFMAAYSEYLYMYNKPLKIRRQYATVHPGVMLCKPESLSRHHLNLDPQ